MAMGRFFLAIAMTACVAMPLSAQTYSEAYLFLKAVREGDGPKVQEIAGNPSSTAINARDPKTGEGALHILVQERNLDWISFLLRRGARPDLQTSDGTTPLALAAQLGWLQGAEQLLRGRAKVDLPNSRGETPLMLTVQASHLGVQERIDMIRLLMSKGADPRRADNLTGTTALDHARRDRRASDILAILEENPAAPAQPVFGPNP